MNAVKILITDIEFIITEIESVEEVADTIINNISELEESSIEDICSRKEVEEVLIVAGHYYAIYDNLLQQYEEWSTIKNPEDYLNLIKSKLVNVHEELLECIKELRHYSGIRSQVISVISDDRPRIVRYYLP